MSVAALLRELASRGVELWVEGDRLRYRSPQNVLNPALLADLKERKAEILRFLKEREASFESHPLSHGQQALWYLHQVAPDSAAYNVAFVARVRGRVDASALRAAFLEVVDRHPSLRTTFPRTDGPPVQTIRHHPEVSFEQTDASGWDGQLLHARVEAAYRRPFDLRSDPLMRIELFSCAPEDSILLVTFHHIVIDFWSLMVLVEELGALYRARLTGTRAELPSVPGAYADYLHGQAKLLASEEGERLWRYWRERLAGELPVLNLPLDRQRPPTQGHRGASHGFRLDDEVVRRLREFAQAQGATLYVTLLTVFQVLLHRYTDQSELLVGTLTAGRSQAELAGVVGYFVNPVVLRTELSGDPPFIELLARVRQVVLEAMDHQEFPFPLLVERLQPSRDASLSPIFQTLFALHRPPRRKEMMSLWAPVEPGRDAGVPWAGLRLEPFALGQQEGQFDLSLEMMEGHDTLSGFFKYNTDLFDAETVRRMAGHFQVLLRGVLEQPRRRLSALSLLPETEREQLLVAWNRTQAPYAATRQLQELFEARASRDPEAVAVVWGEQQLTCGELERRANQLAHHLRSLGVGPEVLVGLCVERSLDMVIGLLGILKAGGAYVPLDPAYPAERLAFMLEDSGAPVLVTQRKVQERLVPGGARCVYLDTAREQLAREDDTAPAVTTDASHLAYVLYTSGSTGKPKGVAITHGSAIAFLYWAREVFSPQELAGVLASTSICFDLSVFELFVPLSWEGRVIVAENALALPTLPRAQEVTLINTVPSAMSELVKVEGVPSSVRTVNLAGEPFKSELVRRIHQGTRVTRVYNLYGPSEDTTYSTVALLADTGDRPPPIGRPISNTQLFVLDRHLQPVPIGVVGELYLGGGGLARGYFARPDLTAERFIPHPFAQEPGARLYKTGDFVRYLPDGNLEFLGRRDHQVKIRGFRIELGEIESALLKHPGVREAVVVARQERPGNKRLVAYVVPRAGQAPEAAELRRVLKERLPEYMVPATFFLLPRFPLTPNGKVDVRALPLLEQKEEGRTRFAPPRTGPEEVLAAIWREVLRLDRVGVNDNFFELGGDSILGILVVSRANQAGLWLSPQQIAQHQTLAELAAVAGVTAPVVAEQGEVTGAVPLMPIQHWLLELEPAQPHHFNQSMLLETPPGLEPAWVRDALNQLLRHHDALRLRFSRSSTGWQQHHAAAIGEVPLRVVDLSGMAEEQQRGALALAAGEAQASLELSQGPLMRAVLFQRGAGTPGRLLLVIHHLSVDGVSWRLLLEDLSNLCHQYQRGEASRLPAKTSSFQHWVRRLVEHAGSAELLAESQGWLERCRREGAKLPVDASWNSGENTFGSVATVLSGLSAEQTRLLLREAPAAYNTQINDLLLTAVARAFHQALGVSPLLVDLEGHGREPLFPDVDLTRTVGWFTTVFPILLTQGAEGDPLEALKSVKEYLRGIPARGIGHGLLRYLHPDAGVRRQLAELPAAQVSFNYLGQLDQLFSESSLFRSAPESRGTEHGPLNRRRYLLDLVGSIQDGRLRLEWHYSDRVHHRATIERLARAFEACLEALLERCRVPGVARHTASDFPAAALSQAELELLCARLQAGGGGTASAEIADIYGLSPMQQGLLFHALHSSGAGLYFEQLTLILRGENDVRSLERAWRELVKRHPVLRSSFHWRELSRPVQVVHPEAVLPWNVVDLRGLDATTRQARRAAWLDADREQGIELERAPLARGTLLHLEEGVHEFVFSHHHLLLDGWSLALLLGEVLACQRALESGAAPESRSRPPYRAYIEWLQRQDLAAAERYWRGQLEGIEAPVSLAEGAESSAAHEEGTDAHQSVAFPAARLESFARAHRLTLSTLVQAAWALLLGRYSGQREVLWGITVAGRPPELPGVEDMVGLFINTLPMRAQVVGDAALIPWLEALHARQQRNTGYGHASLADIQRWSPLPPGTRLFESLVVFENYPMDRAVAELELGDTRTLERTNYPLVLLVRPGTPSPVRLCYDSHRFSASTIARMVACLEGMFEALVDPRCQRLRDLPSVAEAEAALLTRWNDTERDFHRDQSLHRLFEQQVRLAPEAVALVYGERRFTYWALNARANQLAHVLRGLGVGAETPVVLCMDAGPELIIGMLATLKAGGAFVPLDPSHPLQRQTLLMEELRAPVALTLERHLPSLPRGGHRSLCLDSEWERVVASSSEEDLPVEAAAEQTAYVMYTSGSTGRPKGVVVPHRAVSRLVLGTDYVQLGPDDCLAQLANPAFDGSTFEIWGALLNGARVAGISKELALSPRELAAFLREQRVSTLFVTTALFNQIIREVPDALGSLRYALFGGEAVDPKWVARALEQGAPEHLLHVYGPTECTVYSTWWRVAAVPPGATTLPIGGPLANAQVYVLDRELRPVPIGVPGELYIGGLGLARDYLGQPELTAVSFIPHPFSRTPGERLYKTGDRVRMLPDGNLEFLGRIDRQVKIRGFRIEPGEVEATLARHPRVGQVVVDVREDTPGLRRLVAYVVPQPGAAPEVGELERFLAEKLPAHMVPSALVSLPMLPLTPNGKVDRRALPAPVDPRRADDVSGEPRTPTEEFLVAIWRDVLKVERVGREDNFFELGGDSILCIRLVSRAQQAGLRLSVKDVFQFPVIAELAPRVTSAFASALVAEQGPVQGPVPLTPIQQWFFEQVREEPHHFNLSFLLEVAPGVEPALLRRAFQHLVDHHDALRLRFVAEETGWRQHQGLPGEEVSFSVVEPGGAETLESTAAALQSSLELSRGPLLRATLFKAGDGTRDRLLVVIHHLVVDTFSWRILLQDLVTAYQQLSSGEPIRLPAKSTSFQRWSQRLLAEGTRLARASLPYWLAPSPPGVDALLPVDFPTEDRRPTMGSSAIVTVGLSKEETHALLRQTPRAYNTRINDQLLTALVRGFSRWSGAHALRIDLEGHGREELMAGVDVSRTVGWFTTVFPVVLTRQERESPGETLKRVKEQLRQLPNRGMDHGLLRYLSEEPSIRASLKDQPRPQVSFNYLGQENDSAADASPFWEVEGSKGPEHSPRGRRPYLLTVVVRVKKGVLQTQWLYGTDVHRPSTIEHLAHLFLEEVRELIAHCRSSGAGGYTPSDFPEANLSQTALNAVLDEIELEQAED